MSKQGFYDESYEEMEARMKKEGEAIPRKIIAIVAAGVIYTVLCYVGGAPVYLPALSVPFVFLSLYILVHRYKELETF